MNEQAVRFRLGIFVLSALILLAVLIMLFGGWGRLFQHYNEYTIIFDNAAGVAAGTPVRRSGVRIGEVESVQLDSQTGDVRVKIKVASDYVVRKNDVATINRNLLGDTSIDFVPGQPEEPLHFAQVQADPPPPENPPVPPGSTLRGRSRSEGGNLAQQGADLVPVARDTLNEMRKLFDRFNKTLPLIDETVREYRQLGKAMSSLVPEFTKTNESLRELVKSSNATIPELRRTNEEIQITARNWGKLGERLDVLLQTNEHKLTKALDRANDVMNNLQQTTKPLAERTPTIMRNLDESSAKLNTLLTNLGGVFGSFGRGDGTLQRLLSDPSLYNNLNDAACMIARTVPRLDRALADLEIFADKLARHPEAIGLGGVVRPSIGLKEPPTPSSWQGPPTGH